MSSSLIEHFGPSTCLIECPDIASKGSGFLVSNHGHVLTNNHVVARVDFPGGTLASRYSEVIQVTVAGHKQGAILLTDPSSPRPVVFDYAILELESASSAEAVAIGDPASVRRGDDIICLGFPLDFADLVATAGIVSAVGFRPSYWNALHSLRTIVSDAVIQFGNSGGPMLHPASATAIGINTLKHPLQDERTLRLHGLREHPDVATVPGMRELIDYVLRYTDVGLNHAVSIEHAMDDPAWPGPGGGP